MPRRPDPDLENKILDAAQRLWKKGGESSLTMRAVARAAGTNTPAVYRRFRDRDDVLRALLQRIRLEMAAALRDAPSAEEGCAQYLDYALTHPHEYELFYRHNYDLFHSPRARPAEREPVVYPGRDAMRRKLQEELGDSPDRHEALVVALWMVTHGTATLLISKSILPENAAAARTAFREAVRTMLRHAA